MLDAPLKHDIDAELGTLVQPENDLAIVEELRADPAALERLEEELLLHAHA